MNIGVDLDGVIFDSERVFWVYAQFFDMFENGKGIKYPKELRAQQRYDWSAEQKAKFEKACPNIQKIAQVAPFAKQVLQALKEKHKIYIISSRGIMHKSEIDISKQRLQEEGIPFDKIIFKAENKLEECQKLKIDLMIDDFYDTIFHLAKNNIKCLYYCDISTKKIKHKNVVNVKTWGDIAIQLVKKGIISKDDIKGLT